MFKQSIMGDLNNESLIIIGHGGRFLGVGSDGRNKTPIKYVVLPGYVKLKYTKTLLVNGESNKYKETVRFSVTDREGFYNSVLPAITRAGKRFTVITDIKGTCSIFGGDNGMDMAVVDKKEKSAKNGNGAANNLKQSIENSAAELASNVLLTFDSGAHTEATNNGKQKTCTSEELGIILGNVEKQALCAPGAIKHILNPISEWVKRVFKLNFH